MVFVYKKLAQFAVRCALPPRRSESPVCATDNKPSCALHLLGWFIGSCGFSSLERRPEFWVLHPNTASLTVFTFFGQILCFYDTLGTLAIIINWKQTIQILNVCNSISEQIVGSLVQRSPKYNPWVKPEVLPVFGSKVLVETAMPIYLHTICRCYDNRD